MQVALNPYYLANILSSESQKSNPHIWHNIIADSGLPVISFLTAGHLNFLVF